MALDRTTDAIAHFIGALHHDIEAVRMRDGYDAFRAAEREADEVADLPSFSFTVRAPYDLKGFDPGLKVPAWLLPAAAAETAPLFPDGMSGLTPPEPLALPGQPLPGAPGASLSVPPPIPEWDIPLPNSIATVTVQQLVLYDNDVLSFGLGAPFLPPEVFAARLDAMVAQAEDLSLDLALDLASGDLPTVDGARELLDSAEAGAVADGSGAKVAVLRGEAAQGTFVDGEAAGDMPVFRDNAPAGLYPDEDDDAEDDAPNPWAVPDGHHLGTGGNLSINEAVIATNWIDAGVIAVAGDYMRLDVVSQVNVVSDRDTGVIGEQSATRAVNAARISEETAAPKDAPAETDAGDLQLPSFWHTVTIEGDVVLKNYVDQYIFAADHDSAEVVFTAAASEIVMGGNILANMAQIFELGFHYDLIIVGGNMIKLNMIEQINVLLDDDTIGWAGAPFDAVETSGNYLQNSAEIMATGIDTIAEMTKEFREDLRDMAKGQKNISKEVAKDDLFAGKEMLSALYITGDLIEENVIRQQNVVGDSDQVYLAMQEFVAGMDDQMTVSTGANALLNAAKIVDVGLDSTVMVEGEAYSDALIHQAGLIDTEAAPADVMMPGLANEAVAFLANDMIDPATEDDSMGPAPTTSDGGSYDVMQSVLA